VFLNGVDNINAYGEYDKILKEEITQGVVILVIALAVAVIIGIVLFKAKIFEDMRRVERFAFLCILCGIFCTVFIGLGADVVKTISDMKNDSYVTYNGEVEIGETKESYISIDYNGEKIYIKNRKRRITISGEYIGTVVFSERSRILLDIKLYEEKQ